MLLVRQRNESQGPVTPDKCEHSEVIQQSAWGGYPRCRECEVRFVPETLLREAREALDYLYVQMRHHPGRYKLSDLLRRIDAVLGGEAGKGMTGHIRWLEMPPPAKHEKERPGRPPHWGVIRCPVCAGSLPCPPKGLIPLHPTGTGKSCKGGNTFPESPDWVTPPAETTSTPPPAPPKPTSENP